MSKSNKKPRPKFAARQFEPVKEAVVKKEKDWGFEDILRSKRRGR